MDGLSALAGGRVVITTAADAEVEQRSSAGPTVVGARAVASSVPLLATSPAIESWALEVSAVRTAEGVGIDRLRVRVRENICDVATTRS
jgi:hypothetical protein